jgi:succinate dehydrogenase/fumarate reductase flavoprotein subunit
MPEPRQVETDVLVIGAGGAGMYAAIAAADAGAQVLLVDQSLVGRGGATIMAQMTVAAALAEAEPDDWQLHLQDTLKAGRGLCDPALAELLCREAPERIREMDRWQVGWARDTGGGIAQVMAPGHSRRRCCYVDVLNTGPAIAATLRKQVARHDRIRRVSNLMITDLLRDDDGCCGAAGYLMADGTPVAIAAGAAIIAAGGLTKLYRRNSASANMGGHSYALALQAGADLIDMEFVQFFPIGHLAPRLVGMDPIMWDPFRYKLGGRLLNGGGEDFIGRYDSGAQGSNSGSYTTTRDLTTYAILSEVAAGRGSPHGGAYLSFRHLPEAELVAAFGPVIDKLRINGIDLTDMDVEVAPIAHYHMGGIRVNPAMETGIAGLYAAGEAVGGANGANRLSGNAIPEALVFGWIAGHGAAAHAAANRRSVPASSLAQAADTLASLLRQPDSDEDAIAALERRLPLLMWDKVGPFRNDADLRAALTELRDMQAALAGIAVGTEATFNMRLLSWYDLRAALRTAEAITLAALQRTESRGAHQRDDHPLMQDSWTRNLAVRLNGSGLAVESIAVPGA